MDYKIEAESGSFNLQGGDVNFTVGKVIEKIKLSDKVSKVEKKEILDWFKDRYENTGEIIDNLESFIESITVGLNKIVSQDTIDLIVQIISSL